MRSYPPICPNCHRDTWLVRGIGGTAHFEEHYVCPDGHRWNLIITDHGREIVPFVPTSGG